MKTSPRLYPTIRPSHYQLHLTPDLNTFSYLLEETIHFETTTAATRFQFHGEDLAISKATINEIACAISYDKEEQIINFDLSGELEPGSYILTLSATGIIRDDLYGFYRSRVGDSEPASYIATTQFESHFARKSLVCIDEPAAKATFAVTISADPKLTVISNTSETSSSSTASGLLSHTFDVTPKMSTYLLAFIVGKLDFVEGMSQDGVKIRVYTVPGKSEQGTFAVDVAGKVLDFYSDFFDIPYPLPKLDMVAIPDFASAAMENWGLVTYRERALLVDPINSSLATKQFATIVIAHELTHQWFGNLVTMEWWTDLWLNEGFAAWGEVLATDAVFPEWLEWDQFINGRYTEARELDSLANTHPIEIEVTNPAELDEIFDSVTYAKGASVIRMLELFLGKTVFRDGLRAYLKTHAYGSAKTSDLWVALETSSGKPVTHLMSAWTSQVGFPVVSFQANSDELTIVQERFFVSPAEYELNQEAKLWPIPFAYLSENGTSEFRLIEDAKTVIPSKASWVKTNPLQSSFYLTAYTPRQLELLSQQVENLNPMETAGLLADIFLAMQAGKLSAVEALKFALANDPGNSYVVWQAVLSGISEIFGIIQNDDLRQSFEQRIGKFIDCKVMELGTAMKDDESPFDTLLRPRLLILAARAGSEPVISWAKSMFANRHSQAIEPSLRDATYVIVARHGNVPEFDEMWKDYTTSDFQEEKSRLTAGLSGFTQSKVIEQGLAKSFIPEIRNQDAPMYLGRFILNRFARAQTWEFVKANWPEILKRYGQGGHMLSYFPIYLGMTMNTHGEAEDVLSFFSSNPHPAIDRPVQQAVEAIKGRADWADRDQAELAAWLEANR